MTKRRIDQRNERAQTRAHGRSMKLNAKHDTLVEFIANLSYLIDEAEQENNHG